MFLIKWFRRISLAKRFIVVSLTVALILMITLFNLISDHFTDFYIQSEKYHFENRMKTLMTQKLHFKQFSKNWKHTMDFSSIINELTRDQEILELVIYASDGKRLYSSREFDQTEEEHGLCEGLQASVAGKSFYKTRHISEDHHLSYFMADTNADYVQEFYFPYKVKGEVKGIVVVFKDMERIYAVIHHIQAEALLYAISGFIGYALIVGLLTLRIQRREEKLNAKVEQFQKLSFLGQFSAKLAHELGTPIHVIQGNVEIAENLVDDEQVLDRLEVVNRQTEKVQSMVRNFLYASKKPIPEYHPVHLSDFMEEMKETMLQFVVPEDIQLTVQSLDITLLTDPHFLEQVLHNYIKNAVDSIGEGNSGTIFMDAELNKKKLTITIKDSGQGISDKDAAHLFEPFFTTKKTSKGTGLGLVVCKELIESLEGTIFYRTEGDVTVFGLTIPIDGMSV